jgi:hypothetical protein
MARANKDSAVENGLTAEPVKESEPVATVQGGHEGKNAGKYQVISKRFAGKAVYGPAGLVVFNRDGVANISDVEAQHFRKIPGFEVK